MLAFDGSYNEAIEKALTNNLTSPGIGLQLFNIRICDEGGIWGPLYKRVVYMQIPGNTLPVNLSTNIPSNTICQGSSIQLTATGGNLYSWSPTTGLSSTTGSVVTANPMTTTTYTVTGSNIQGNSGTATVTVVVNNPPLANIQSTYSTCPTSVTLTATGGSSFLWSNGSSAQTIIITPISNEQYSVFVSQNGCSSNAAINVFPIDTLTWTGLVDNDWHKSCNWNPQAIPKQCNPVIIPFTNNQPIISQIAACKDITIYATSGANLVINSNAILQIESSPIAPTQISCP